jgi:hypothetical protein
MGNSDASKNILGFKYQEMVALIECLNTKEEGSIYLECFGDISDGKISTEIKHSVDENKTLIDTSKDFWKTLYNILDDYELFESYDKFVLHTTAKIDDSSIFFEWSKMSSDKKLEKILSVTSNNGIRKYTDTAKDFDKEDILNVLGKFKIIDNQKNAKQFYKDELLQHSGIATFISENNIEDFVYSLLGYINAKLIIAEDYKWEIDISDFRRQAKSYAKHYEIGDLEFPKLEAESYDTSNRDYMFVKKLLDIEHIHQIGKAVECYLKASESHIKMIEERDSLCTALDDYDEDLRETIDIEKGSHLHGIEEADEAELMKKSREFYNKSVDVSRSMVNIDGVTKLRPYYPIGRLQNNAETDSEFCWKLL